MTHEVLMQHCKHQAAYMKFDEDDAPVAACGYKDGKPAQCWADWQPCTKENCPLLKGEEKEH